ncbi:hypothetical protein CL651_001940 [bacterium]|nr:hypothetical protein [bacterium]
MFKGEKNFSNLKELVAILFSPFIAYFLIGYMVGNHFLDYSLHSDAAWELTYMKLFKESIFSSVYANPGMGAPLSISHDFWPWRQAVLGLYYFIIGIFKPNILEIYETYYYSLFPVCALMMYLSLRFYFKTSVLIALGFGTLYAFIPFITVHHIHTSVQINNVGIPLLIGLVFYFQNKDYSSQSIKSILLKKEIFIAVVVIFLGMSLSAYNSFYFFLVLVFIIFRELFSFEKNNSRLKVFLFFFFIGILTLIFNIYPHIMFKSDSYFTYDYMTRNFAHSTVYGISIVEFFVPVADHLINYFRFISDLYNDNTEIRINFLSSYLGIIGILSFCTAIFYSFKNVKDSYGKKIKFLGILLIFILILFYRGGIITAFYLFTDFMVLGSHYRVTPWIGCISLIVGAIIFDKIRAKYISKIKETIFGRNFFLSVVSKGLFVVFFVSIIALSLLDFRGLSSPFGNKSPYGNLESVYLPQKQFYDELNTKIDDNDMILKIPYRCFPETRHTYGSFYGDVWAYLMINKKTRFSWMAFKEGTACVINTQISSMVSNLEDMVKYAKYYGYTGIIVNKKGFADDGVNVINDFDKKLNLQPLVESKENSYFGEYSYFDISLVNQNYKSLKITPIEGNPINKITAKETVTKDDINNILRIFPSPCSTNSSLISNRINKKGSYEEMECDPVRLQNNEFFYFSNDKINTYPEIIWKNGEMLIDKDYVGPVLSIAIHSDLKKGEYSIKIISNKEVDSNLKYFDFNITQWGKNFRKKDNFIFSLKDDAPARKLKAIWVHIFKKTKTDSDLNLRAISIRKIK